ncbi:MAG: hypothetical protein GX442_19645 [Candidatus Riflebacteria bacterium]|nr:hypothetical protein [Candidatus Riflebacteria bacterium]
MARRRENRVAAFLLKAFFGHPGSRGGTLAGILLVFLVGMAMHGTSQLLLAQDAAGESAPEAAPAEGGEAKPAEEAKPADEGGDPKPADEAKPADEGGDPKPADEAKPAGEGGEAPAPAEGEPPPEGGGEGAPEGEEPPPPPVDAEAVQGEASGLIQAGKCAEAVSLLQDKQYAFASAPALLELYVEALVGCAKPNWGEIEGKAKELVDANPKHPLGNYALGRALAEKKNKPNLAKALEHLAIAKSGKKPYKDAGTVYYKVWARKNWAILVGALGIVVVVGVKVAQKRKAAKAAAADLAAIAAAASEGAPAAPPADAKTPDAKAAEAKAAEAKPAEGKAPEGKPADAPPPKPAAKTATKTAAKGTAEGKPKAAKTAPPTAAKPAEPAPPPEEAAPEAPPRPAPKPAPKSSPEPQAAPAPTPPASRKPTPAVEEMDLTSAAQPRPSPDSPFHPSIPTDAKVDAVWDRLCRQAVTKPLPVDFQQARPAPRSFTATSPLDEGYVGPDDDLTIDLTPEALRVDLLGKLKMLAITDGELRQLLLQRNPDHIPNLCEYILTKPDPARLAFLAREMGNYHDPAVNDVLDSLLFHEDLRVVLAAIQGLQTNGGAGSILPLCPFVQSSVPAIAEAARQALASFGAPRIFEAFTHLPGHPDERVRAAGVFILARMRGDKVVRLLTSLLADPAVGVRQEVLLAMALQKDPNYLPALREFARKATTEEDKRMARKAIVYLQGFAATAAPPAARTGTGPRAA